MRRNFCNRASIKKLKTFADKSKTKDTSFLAITRQLELHPNRNPSYSKRNFRQISIFGDSSLRNLGISFGLSHGYCKGYASSAAAEEIVSTEEDSDEIREMVRHLNTDIKAVEIKSSNSNNRKQPKLVNGMGQGKYIALRRRQIKIETEAWEAAAKEYQELLVDMCEQKLAPNLPYVKSLFLGWFEPLKNAISAEQDLCKEGKNRGAYAPQFDQLPADMMTIITMHKLMGLLMTGGGQGGARVVQAALHIGEAIEHEARIHRFIEKSKRKGTLNESPDDDSEAADNEQKMQKLRKKVNVLVKKKKLQQVRHIVKQQDDLVAWGQDAQVKVGSRLIQLLMETAYIQPPVEQFEDCPPDIRPAFVHTLKTVETPRGSRRYGVIECDPLVRKGLEKSAMHMVIPYMPMLLPPVNWTGYNRGGYLFLPSYIMRTHGAKQQRDVVKRTPKKQLEPVFEALNTLGATKWRVNRNVLGVVDRIWASGGRLADLVDRDDVARKMKDEEGFYYPHNLDFCGRAYPMHPYLNHLGSDLCRGVLEFAEGRPLGESGFRWLKIHLANVYGGGVDKLSHEGRVAFTEKHVDDIFDSSDRLLEGKRWWLRAEDPFQCLATCMNLSEALSSSSPETTISHMPIHQDGSCNGLQHYAALGRDKLGAAAVNLVEGEKPADVYSRIASRFALSYHAFCIRHQCRSLLHRPFTSLNTPTLFFTKSSSLISAQALQFEPATTSSAANADFPRGILQLFKLLGGSTVKFDGLKNGFKTLVSGLNCSQVDEIINHLRKDDPDSAVELFELLKIEYGFRHSRVSQFVIAHILASQRRLKLLRSNFMQMLQDEGTGSGPSLCEKLSIDFKGWSANAIVWDMLAFAYSRSEMVQDALFVIAKMKDLNIQPSILTYNILLYNLRHSDIMWDVYNDIKESGVHESKQTKSILVDGLCKQSLMQEAVTLLRGKDVEESSPHVTSFNTVMSSFSKMGFVDIAQSVFCLMLKFGVQPDAYSYNILINGLCLAGSIEDALKLTYDMDKHGVEPDAVTYYTISKGFYVVGRINGALKSIQQTLTKGLNPDSITYTLLICGHCHAGRVDESLGLRDEMLSLGYQPNYISYSVLVSSLCKIGRVDEGLFLLYEMEIIGLKPDDVMYSIIIHGLCKQGKAQRAIQLYTEMCSKRIFPTIFAHRAVLLGLCDNRPLSEARMYFDMLTSSDGNRDIVLYNIMINKYAKLGMIHEAVQLYNQIIKNGIDSTIVTFNSIIYGLCVARQLTKAMRLFDDIRDHGLAPTAITYTTLMNFLCEEGNIQEMFDLKREMEANGVEPTHVTYTVIIKGLCKQQKLQESLLHLDSMLSRGLYPDEVLYNILIQRFCKAREIAKAFELHDEMISRGLKPDAVTYNILINGLCVYGDVQDADKFFLYLRETNVVGLKKAAYTTLIKAHCVRGDPHQAMAVFCEMVKMGFQVTIKDYSSVINRLCKRCLTTEAKVFLSMMFSNGILPDIHLYREMIYALFLVGDHHSIHELLPNMVKCGLDAS